MSSDPHYAMLAGFNRWANGHIYDCCAMLTEDDYRQDRGAFFGSVHNTLNHLLLIDMLWGARISGTTPPAITGLDDILYDDFDEMRDARKTEDEKLIALVEGLSGDDLQTAVSYTLSNGTAMRTERWLMLSTLFNHQTHHRGQIHCLLTQSDVSIPPIDIIYYAREVGLS
ncbi:MAG: DinB family protein [Alphaproteobacteria bacterium]